MHKILIKKGIAEVEPTEGNSPEFYAQLYCNIKNNLMVCMFCNGGFKFLI